MKPLKILIGFEESGRMRRAFRGYGHEAFSCDKEPARDNSPFHYQADIYDVLGGPCNRWDLIILHPPCDFMANSGNRWYGKGTPGHQKRLDSIEWTLDLIECALNRTDHLAVENPVSALWAPLKDELDMDCHYVQPHMFGHPELKATGFGTFNLPDLVPTRQLAVPGTGTAERIAWQQVWRMPPGPNRKRDRSETYLGIADACADQWGRYVMAQRRGIEIVGGMGASDTALQEVLP